MKMYPITVNDRTGLFSFDSRESNDGCLEIYGIISDISKNRVGEYIYRFGEYKDELSWKKNDSSLWKKEGIFAMKLKSRIMDVLKGRYEEAPF